MLWRTGRVHCPMVLVPIWDRPESSFQGIDDTFVQRVLGTEWNRKPFTATHIAALAGRARSNISGISELQMVSTRTAVHIGDFFAMFPMGGNEPIQEIEANLLPSAKIALDELVWWAKATIGAKATEA